MVKASNHRGYPPSSNILYFFRSIIVNCAYRSKNFGETGEAPAAPSFLTGCAVPQKWYDRTIKTQIGGLEDGISYIDSGANQGVFEIFAGRGAGNGDH